MVLGLTQLGYQNPFRGRRREPDTAEKFGRHDGKTAGDKCQVRSEPMLSLVPEKAHTIVQTQQECLEENYFGRLPPICDASVPLEPSPYHNKSVEKFTHMKRLGLLPKAPNMLYREPLTTSQQYGWWMPQDPKENLLNTEPWTRVTRYPHVHSEMTRYVARMALTNPQFSLF